LPFLDLLLQEVPGVASIESVKTPYLILGAAFLVVAVIFKFSSIPNKIDLEKIAADEADDANKVLHKKSALSYQQLVLGMIGIFVYVGVEVSTASNLPEFMKVHLKIPTESIAPFISLYWASLMIGRWTGAVGAFGVSKSAMQILKFVMPYVAFGVFLLVNRIANHDLTPFYVYAFVIIAMIIGDL
jgi:FHS family L-fucose permease-like MFS transporter